MNLLATISSTAAGRSARLAGIGLMLAGVCFFSLGDALGKFMVATYSVGELLLLRSVAALVLMSPLIWRSRGAFALVRRPALQVLRALDIGDRGTARRCKQHRRLGQADGSRECAPPTSARALAQR